MIVAFALLPLRWCCSSLYSILVTNLRCQGYLLITLFLWLRYGCMNAWLCVCVCVYVFVCIWVHACMFLCGCRCRCMVCIHMGMNMVIWGVNIFICACMPVWTNVCIWTDQSSILLCSYVRHVVACSATELLVIVKILPLLRMPSPVHVVYMLNGAWNGLYYLSCGVHLQFTLHWYHGMA